MGQHPIISCRLRPISSQLRLNGVVKMTRLRHILSMIFLSCAFQFTQTAYASSTNGACAADIKRLCPGVNPDAKHIAKCLKEHESELSSACKEKAKDIHDSCKDDARKLCGDVGSGAGPLAQCLKNHEANLSQDCRQALPQSLK